MDMLRGDVLRATAGGAVERWHVGDVVAAVRPRGDVGLVLAVERSFVAADRFGGPVSPVTSAIAEPGSRFNEGSCDPEGNFLCGTMSYDEARGRGKLYRLRTDHTVNQVLEGVTISNGLAWDADGRQAYYVDSGTGRIDLFDHDSVQGLSNRRPFVAVPSAAGTPDGLTVDSEGGVWVALWNGSAVRRYDARGHLSAVIEVPVAMVTSCTFGGANLDELYISTSRLGEAVGENSAAGAVFRVSPGVRGLPVLPYAG